MSDSVNTDDLREIAGLLREHGGLGDLVNARMLDAAADEIDRLRDGIRKIHVKATDHAGFVSCEKCVQVWPCATRKLVDGDA